MWGEMGMNGLNKFFFWFFVIVLAFMPYGIIMTFAILLLHYGVPYIKSELKDVCNDCSEEYTVEDDHTIKVEPKTETLNEYSNDTLEEMK